MGKITISVGLTAPINKQQLESALKDVLKLGREAYRVYPFNYFEDRAEKHCKVYFSKQDVENLHIQATPSDLVKEDNKPGSTIIGIPWIVLDDFSESRIEWSAEFHTKDET